MPYMITSDNGKYCVCKQNADKTAGDSLHCYTGDGAEEKAKSYMKALYAAEGDKKMSSPFQNLLSSIKGLLHLQGDESLDEKIGSVRYAFYKAFEQIYQPEPSCYVEEVFDGYVIIEQGDKKFKAGYSIDGDGNITFDPKDQWKEVKEQYVEMSSWFSFTELSGDPNLKYIDGLAAGTFVSMSGEEVTFEAAELSTYIDNTQKIIESTRTEKGEIVGLPIDKDRHDHAGGAGWIVGLELDQTRNVIRFLVNWTKEGVDLISGNIRRFFSPSTNPDQKVILGGSLTNWPATRLETGQILLRPVELSQSIKEIDMPKTLDEYMADLKAGILEAVGKSKPAEPQAEPPAKTETGISPNLRELLNTPEAIEELGQQATKIAQDAIRAEQRKMHVVEFTSKLVGGTKDKPFGLRVKPHELVAFLLSLNETQAKFAEKVLADALDAAIDFAEHGYDSEGFIQKPRLPGSILPYARQWVDAKKPLSEFFAQNPELGPADQYNLVEFMQVKE